MQMVRSLIGSIEISLIIAIEAMQGMSEDEGDADDEPAVKFDEEKAAVARKAREEREQKLQEMMEADSTSTRSYAYVDILLTYNSRHARCTGRRD